MVELLRASPISADVTPDLDHICLYLPYSSHWIISGQQNFFRYLGFESRFRLD